MNIYLSISINLLIGCDATTSILLADQGITQTLAAIRFSIALVSVICHFLIHYKIRVSLLTLCLQLLYQVQLASEIRQAFSSLDPYHFYIYLLLLYQEQSTQQHKYLQYSSIVYCMVEIQLNNTFIHQYIITTLISILIILIKLVNLQQLRHKHATSHEVLYSYSTVPAEQIMSNRKIDLIQKDELIYITNHIKQGIIYFSTNLDILYINDKASKILMAQTDDQAMLQLQKMILQGLEQEESLTKLHKEIKCRASQKQLPQKADGKMIESLIASAEKHLKRCQSLSEKILEQQFQYKKQKKKNYLSKHDFKQLLLSLFSESQTSSLLEHRSFVKANKLTVNFSTNNHEKTIEVTFCKLINLLNQNCYLTLFQDVSEIEKQQQFVQKYKFQTLYFNSFSHELRTPLNCSLNLLQALKHQPIQENLIQQYINPSIVSNKLLMHQINDILDYASLGLGTFHLNMQEFLIKDVYNQLEEYYQDICQSKGIKLNFQIADGLENIKINNDPERILQLLVNFINNSLKFTELDDTISITAKKKQKPSGLINFIKFIVHDTGKGISKVDLEAINNIVNASVDDSIFYQLRNFTTKYVGLGFSIGMKMNHELSYSKKSYFKIRSKEGEYTKISFRINNQMHSSSRSLKGSTIRFDEIPESGNLYDERITVEDHQMPLWNQTFFTQRQHQNDQNPPILICDDVPFNLLSLNLLIKNLGFESEMAYDGQDAINRVKNRQKMQLLQYKLILMDIEMPGLNGYQTSVQLLQIDSKLNIVMCSAYDSENNLLKALESGMKEILIKPVKFEQLRQLIFKYIK
ncbi:unnamed protein product (macronuclear) [Paramecium tetraurelia]|uniref:Response regulatory domain-containing protein n=1 Tax=Paramecium tetraurelia TaxID=5888 RepID=A0DXX3_PARTE|nr:uncharacterized protein GSPATT00021514001 [Paramecium tetraurelia]CAK87890.1 unnamed protein product [Paramecium tetraurelia]|eukprot:XP_001455287.1 hypothetical protein (macronuclear) [Paramecium tetraurelia strain d4-2]